MPERVAQRLAARSLEAEPREIDDGFFTELDERQPEVRILVQRLLPDLVEDRRSRVVVAALEVETNQPGMRGWGADGIPERDPRPSLDAVHDEASTLLVEEQRLVPQIHEVR